MKGTTTKKWLMPCIMLAALCTAAVLSVVTNTAFAAQAQDLDYTFETVPAENIMLTVDGDITEIQPRQSFSVSFEITPWYTTTGQVFVDVFPQSAASVTHLSQVTRRNGKAQGSAVITVAENAEVGSALRVVVGADNIESNATELTVAKIPVVGLTLSAVGTDDKLHIGKSRAVTPSFVPAYATVQDIRYELSGSVEYIAAFDETTGTVTAKNDVTVMDVNATVTVTAYSKDNPNAFDSVTWTLYMPTTVVEISASTPRGRTNADGNPLAVADSKLGDTVTLHTKVNGVESTGLNYVIVEGQEYVENGIVQSGGILTLRSTSNWSLAMQIPHAKIKIRASYSDGFDEITIAVYVPVERISFVNSVPDEVENYRSYDLSAVAFPAYATQSAESAMPILYELADTDESIAGITDEGLLRLPKSLTSKGSVIRYVAKAANAWEGVDVAPLTHTLTVVPVYATAFQSITITKDGVPIGGSIQAMPSDMLQVEVVYTVDNVTEIDVSLQVDSVLLTVDRQTLRVAPLASMNANTPTPQIRIEYDCGGNRFADTRNLFIYIPAVSAEIADVPLHRDAALDLKPLVTVNGHGFAANREITWGTPTVTNGKQATLENGVLRVASAANAGTVVRVPYKTFDSETWQYKEFTVAALGDAFRLQYGQSFNSVDNRQYDIDENSPQLEAGQNVRLLVTYKNVGGAQTFGLSYTVTVSSNATLSVGTASAGCDEFLLSALPNQSGRNNRIEYCIKIVDGDQTYCIKTIGAVAPSGSVVVETTNAVSIFRRISGKLDVKNATASAGDTLSLSGWNDAFTVDTSSLTYTISGGKTNGNKIETAPLRGFILTISATQMYNGVEIPYAQEISFSAIVYRNGEDVRAVYKKQNGAIVLAGRTYTKDGFIQTGWAIADGGDKKYAFETTYYGSADLDLYPFWVQTRETVTIEEQKSLDENQNKDIFTESSNFTEVNFDTLRELGYTQIEIKISAVLERNIHDGNFAHLWLELDGERILSQNNFEPVSPKGTQEFTATVDIAKFKNNSTIRLGFYTDDDGIWGKFTWTFYSADITFQAV